jgi:hypothetical protein
VFHANVAGGFRYLTALFSLVLFAPAAITRDKTPSAIAHLGTVIVPLNGPWRFHMGDNPHWADAGFGASSWERMDLTHKHGAHNDDVGLRSEKRILHHQQAIEMSGGDKFDLL